MAVHGTKHAGDAGCADNADTVDMHQTFLYTVVAINGTKTAGDAGCADNADTTYMVPPSGYTWN